MYRCVLKGFRKGVTRNYTCICTLCFIFLQKFTTFYSFFTIGVTCSYKTRQYFYSLIFSFYFYLVIRSCFFFLLFERPTNRAHTEVGIVFNILRMCENRENPIEFARISLTLKSHTHTALIVTIINSIRIAQCVCDFDIFRNLFFLFLFCFFVFLI